MESVQQLVEMLGGEWRSHAEEACLRFALPTNEPRTLLAIDDNEGLIRLLRRYLAEHNVQVVEATNGSDALRLAQELQPDAITLDVMMPSQDGWEVLQRLKSEPATQHIPVVICSVLDDPELAFSLGAAAYLKKPVSQADLMEALSSLGGG
jgi:CheY-like chemotaxis protein